MKKMCVYEDEHMVKQPMYKNVARVSLTSRGRRHWVWTIDHLSATHILYYIVTV